ncbi:hypothetical protein [Prosthecobacter sp.]|uniref:hypothetical protein n=1 Tax=Prosthecobacter sp. TaxID=1965333 RepID=UPI002ABB7550|nr:hypothetical protein [Prosthecobacter sp.]MDZ4405915.1 hypothetical protein [Prosthecobacter sp.]
MRKRISILLVVLAAAAVPAWYAFAHGYRSTTSYTCVRCRAIQHVATFFGRESVRVEETDYSRWFALRQPMHAHEWGWCGTIITCYPISYARGCGRQHPVWQIRPEWQRQFLESATASQVESFYAGLDSPDRAIQQRTVEMVFDSVTGDTR